MIRAVAAGTVCVVASFAAADPGLGTAAEHQDLVRWVIAGLFALTLYGLKREASRWTARFDRLEEKMDRVVRALWGNEERPGIIGKMAIIEREHERNHAHSRDGEEEPHQHKRSTDAEV